MVKAREDYKVPRNMKKRLGILCLIQLAKSAAFPTGILENFAAICLIDTPKIPFLASGNAFFRLEFLKNSDDEISSAVK